MTEKIRLELDDGTAAGLNSVESSLKDVGNAAGATEKQLNDAADAAANLGNSVDSDSAREIERLNQVVSDLQQELNDAAAEADELRMQLDNVGDEAAATGRQLKQAGKAANDFGDGGKDDVKGLGLSVSDLNQGFELVMKAVEAAHASVVALADAGNPAAQKLVESWRRVHDELIKIGDDPIFVDAMNDLTRVTEENVIPTVGKVPGALRSIKDALSTVVTVNAEFLGFFPKGTLTELWEDQKALEEIAEAQRKINQEKRETYIIEGRSAEVAQQAAADVELRNIAKLESERQLKDLLELETEARRELVEAGELSGKKMEESDRRVETIQRRLVELPQLRADAESKAANEAAQAKIKAAEEEKDAKLKAQEEYDEALRKSDEERKRLDQERLDKATAEANAAADRLLKAIEQAKGVNGKPLIDEARANITPEATRAQLVKQSQEEARQKYISENRDKVDLEGRASGNTDAERKANQRKADYEIAQAQRKAGSQAFREFNTGKTSQADVTGAQNALIQASAEQANARGTLDNNLLQAITTATQNQQQQAANTETLAQQMRQVQAALAQVNGSTRNLNAASRRAGL